MNNRLKSITDFLYKKDYINPWDVKLKFGIVNKRKKALSIKRRCKTLHEFEIIDICDDDYSFVINPNNKIEATQNGGTIKLIVLPKGYKLSIEKNTTHQGPSGELNVSISEIGFSGKLDNLSKKGFKFNLNELTHEHLVLVVNSRPEKESGCCKCWYCIPPVDIAKIDLDWIKLKKHEEENILKSIEYAKKNEIV